MEDQNRQSFEAVKYELGKCASWSSVSKPSISSLLIVGKEIISNNTCLLFLILQDPEVMAAFQDVAQNPANVSKYQNNPKVMNLIGKLSAKFGTQA